MKIDKWYSKARRGVLQVSRAYKKNPDKFENSKHPEYRQELYDTRVASFWLEFRLLQYFEDKKKAKKDYCRRDWMKIEHRWNPKKRFDELYE